MKPTTKPSRTQSEYSLAKPSPAPATVPQHRPTWKPEPWVPVRPGADDHKQYASKGIV